jgi:thymidine kinase
MAIHHNITNLSEVISIYKDGYLKIYTGPMYSGKSTILTNIYNHALSSNIQTIVLTHQCENRYSKQYLSTHNKQHIPCCKYNSITEFIKDKHDEIIKSDVILIDEAQFFEDLLEVLRLVDSFKKCVYVFGLSGDFKRNKFGHIPDLMVHCDDIEKLSDNCKLCTNKSVFSSRTIKSECQILVGSVEAYQSLCRKCYNDSMK